MTKPEKKYFKGILNSDDAIEFIGEDQFINSENVRYGTTDKGVIGTIESIGGTLMLSSAEPSVNWLYLGGAEDEASSRFVYCLYNLYSPWHKIMCYSLEDDTIYTVLLSQQVTGGLNFNKNYFIHSARIINGLFYFTDNLNEPRVVNIDAGIKLNQPSYDTDTEAYSNPLLQKDISLIKMPTVFPPMFTKQTDGGVDTNFIADQSFEFAWMYDYRDFQQSVISEWSKLAPYNVSGDTYNYIQVKMNLSEYIHQTVQAVNLVVRNLNANSAVIVKTWSKDNTVEAAEIESQNNGTQLSFDFYNNISGVALSTTQLSVVEDAVPPVVQTLEVARNRLFLANYEVSFNQPRKTSLSISIIDANTGSSIVADVYQGKVKYTHHITLIETYYAAYFVNLTTVPVPGWYLVNGTSQTDGTSYPVLPPPPASQAFSSLTFYGDTQFDAAQEVVPAGNLLDEYNFYDDTTNITITGVSTTATAAFKTNSPYQVGIAFYDRFKRRIGMYTDDTLMANIDDRAYTSSIFKSAIAWALSNASAADEIPEDAYYYSIVRTQNLRTRYFVQSFDAAPRYARKKDDGTYDIDATPTVATNKEFFAINLASLLKDGMGYVYNNGDLARVYYYTGNPVTLKVYAQQGKYVILDFNDFGTLTSSSKLVYELYTPYQTSEQEYFYEVGNLYEITDPRTSARSYSVLAGTLTGDVYLLNRASVETSPTTYQAEAMSTNDKYWQTWFTDIGWPFPNVIGERLRKPYSMRFSGVWATGTKNNNTSSFLTLDEKTLSPENGQVQKLQLTSKAQAEGTVMLAICNNETNSIYLEEAQVTDTRQVNVFFTKTEGVIGSVNILRGSFGTRNPESVVAYRGNVYWLDMDNGRYIQYSQNGLFPISNYKMTRFWNLFCQQFLSMTTEEIEALGGRPFVFSTVDPYHNELVISIPKLLSVPPKGYLPDYPSTIYPFDIWDGQAKTIVYKLDLGDGQPHWQGAYTFYSEGFVSLENKLYSFSSGHLFLHNQTTNYNQFYGVQYKSRVMFVSNEIPSSVKSYNSISIEGNMIPTLTYFYTLSPYQQSSDLMDFDYNTLEGFYYATLYRNKLVPTAIGYNTNGLLTGEKIRTNTLMIMLEFTVSITPLELRFSNVSFAISKGHRT